MTQPSRAFGQRAKAGRRGELRVSRLLERSGFIVENLNDTLGFGEHPPVDLAVTKAELSSLRVAVEVKVRITRNRTDLWLPSSQIPRMQEFQQTTKMPVVISFNFYNPTYSIEFASLDDIVLTGTSSTGVTTYIQDSFQIEFEEVYRELQLKLNI